jgi:DNA-binding response OmpR family regulator
MTTSAARVLVVDDEPQIVRGLKIILRSAGYAVDCAASKDEALAALAARPPDAIVLDLVLPDGRGTEVCQEVRRWSRLPILVLSAVGDEAEKVRALDAGADDYVTKPFSLEEVMARVRSTLRRSRMRTEGERLELAELVLDARARTVTAEGRPVELTGREFDLLELFMRHPGQALPRTTILSDVWGYDFLGGSNVIDVYVRTLRRKLECAGERRLIQTVRGVGYALREPL